MSTVQHTNNPGGPRVSPSHKTAPGALWADVLKTRASLVEQQRHPQSSSVPAARLALVHALEAYFQSLLDRFRPIPRVLQDELRIQRALCQGPAVARHRSVAKPRRA
jgi:hypothetical protein